MKVALHMPKYVAQARSASSYDLVGYIGAHVLRICFITSTKEVMFYPSFVCLSLS